MRTTLDIDEDLMLAAKQMAVQRGNTIGQVVSQLIRKAMEPQASPSMRNGIPLFTTVPGAVKPSLALINRLRDEA